MWILPVGLDPSVVSENCAPNIRVCKTAETRRGKQRPKTVQPEVILSTYKLLAGRYQNAAAQHRRPFRCVVETTQAFPKIWTENHADVRAIHLQPWPYAPPIVVGRTTSRGALAQTQADALPHTPGDPLVHWGGTHASPRICRATTQILRRDSIFRRQSTRPGLT